MFLMNQINNLIYQLINIINSINFFLVILILTLIVQFLIYFIRDRKLSRAFNSFRDPDHISITDLKFIPLVNIIVPAWREGKLFNDALISIKNLTYPKIKIIVNAGGNKETLDIANSFKKYDNFQILHQKGGADRPSLGKIKAVNDCLSYITEGIIYLIDADTYLRDEILLRMLFPIVNYNEKIVVGGVRPLRDQENINLVKYLHMDRNNDFKIKFYRYSKVKAIAGTNTCFSYDVIKTIGKFSENKLYSTDGSMGKDITSKGYKIYRLHHYGHRIFVDFPSSCGKYIHQKTVWTENRLNYALSERKIGRLLKIIILDFLSFYIIISPFLIFLNFGLFFIGIGIFLNLYLKKIRKYIFFKLTLNRQYQIHFPKTLFLRLIFYIFLEAANNFFIPFHFLIYRKKFKKKK